MNEISEVTKLVVRLDERNVSKEVLLDIINQAKKEWHPRRLSSLPNLNSTKATEKKIFQALFEVAARDFKGKSESDEFYDIEELREMGITDQTRREYFPRNDYWRHSYGYGYCQLFLRDRIDYFLATNEKLKSRVEKCLKRREKLEANKEEIMARREEQARKLKELENKAKQIKFELELSAQEVYDALILDIPKKAKLKEISEEIFSFVRDYASDYEEQKQRLLVESEGKWEKTIQNTLNTALSRQIDLSYPKLDLKLKGIDGKKSQGNSSNPSPFPSGALVVCKAYGKYHNQEAIVKKNIKKSCQVKFREGGAIRRFKRKNLRLIAD